MDLEKLTPAPWEVVDRGRFDHRIISRAHGCICEGCQANAAAFIALARNAFDVMMRRKFVPWSQEDGWTVYDEFCMPLKWGPHKFADPFTALVEADRWYKENVEKS